MIFMTLSNSGVVEMQPGPVSWGGYNPLLLLPGEVRLWLYHSFAAAGKLACSYRFRQILYSSEQYHSGIIKTDGVTPSEDMVVIAIDGYYLHKPILNSCEAVEDLFVYAITGFWRM